MTCGVVESGDRPLNRCRCFRIFDGVGVTRDRPVLTGPTDLLTVGVAPFKEWDLLSGR